MRDDTPILFSNTTVVFFNTLVVLFYDDAWMIIEKALILTEFLDAEVGAYFTTPVGEIGLEGFAFGDDVGDGFERKRQRLEDEDDGEVVTGHTLHPE